MDVPDPVRKTVEALDVGALFEAIGRVNRSTFRDCPPGTLRVFLEVSRRASGPFEILYSFAPAIGIEGFSTVRIYGEAEFYDLPGFTWRDRPPLA